jgi:hypothetical protein
MSGAPYSPIRMAGGKKGLLDAITSGETNASLARKNNFDSVYDVPLEYGKYGIPNKPLTQMTMAELYTFQKAMLKNKQNIKDHEGNPSSAAGKYQLVSNTIFGKGGTPGNPKPGSLMAQAGLSPGDKFTPENQEKMAMLLLDEQIRTAGGDKAKLGQLLEKQWTSYALPQNVSPNQKNMIVSELTASGSSTSGRLPSLPTPANAPTGSSLTELFDTANDFARDGVFFLQNFYAKMEEKTDEAQSALLSSFDSNSLKDIMNPLIARTTLSYF